MNTIEDDFDEIPACGDEQGCKIIENFLDNNTEFLKAYELNQNRETEIRILLNKKQDYLNFLREEENKIIIEIYMLKNKPYNG